MTHHEYHRTTLDHCIYVKKFSNGNFVILLQYIVDILIVGCDTIKLDRLNKELSKSFAMNDLGQTRQILGIKISRDRQNGKH